MSRRLLILLVVSTSALAPVVASEVIFFANGATMEVRSHKLDGDMIRVDLGQNATMAFPTSMVERIESGGRAVWTGVSYRPANQAVPGAPDAGGGDSVRAASAPPEYQVTGASGVPSRRRQGQLRSEQDREGMVPVSGMQEMSLEQTPRATGALGGSRFVRKIPLPSQQPEVLDPNSDERWAAPPSVPVPSGSPSRVAVQSFGRRNAESIPSPPPPPAAEGDAGQNAPETPSDGGDGSESDPASPPE